MTVQVQFLIIMQFIAIAACGSRQVSESSDIKVLDEVKMAVPNPDGSVTVHCKSGHDIVYSSYQFSRALQIGTLCEEYPVNPNKNFLDICLQNQWSLRYQNLMSELLVLGGVRKNKYDYSPLNSSDKASLCQTAYDKLRIQEVLSLEEGDSPLSQCDFSPLRGFAVKRLKIKGWKESAMDLKILSELANLEELSLEDFSSDSMEYFATGFASLKKLNIQSIGTSLEVLGDWKQFDHLTNLEELNLAGGLTAITSVRFLAKMNKLKSLFLQNAALGPNIDILREIPNLSRFECNDCNIFDLRPIKDQAQLTHVKISANKYTLDQETCPTDGLSPGVTNFCQGYLKTLEKKVK